MKTQSVTYLNQNFRFVYEPNYKDYDMREFFKTLESCLHISYNSKRFLISAGSLHFYLGDQNAKTLILATEKMKTDKKTIKFRKYGKIEIYVK